MSPFLEDVPPTMGERVGVGLAGFLLARLADDEAAAHVARDQFPMRFANTNALGLTDHLTIHLDGPFDPARVLAEVEAKRRIVELLALPYIAERRRLMNGQPSWGDENPDLLRFLAQPYADHPDFDPAWRI